MIVEKIETKDTILPLIEKGENLDIVDSKVNKVTKKPPKYHTEKTLLRALVPDNAQLQFSVL